MLPLKSLSHIMLHVSDVSRSIDWYKRTLGFAESYSAAPHYASLFHEKMNFRLDLHGPSTHGKHPATSHGASPWFEVDDIAVAVAELRRQGIQVPDPRRESNSPLFTSFSDPDGNEIGIAQSE